MEAVSSNLYVILLITTPLAAAMFSLLNKIFPRFHTTLFAFFIWFIGSTWSLWHTASAAIDHQTFRYAVGGWQEPFGIVLELNSISWIISLLSVVIITVVWTATYRQTAYKSTFYLVLYLLHFSLQGILFSRDLFNLFVWFEVLSLCSIVLVAYERRPPALLAAFRYLLLSTISIVFYLLGLWIIYSHTGGLAFSGIGEYAGSLSSSSEARKTIGIALSLISAGVLTRSAIIPFHTWLPPAHSAAPFPVSALLSGLVIKIPLVALWHFFLYLPSLPLSQLFLWLGFASTLAGGFMALLQTDVKKILAYSSIGQMGFILVAFAAGSQLSGGQLTGGQVLEGQVAMSQVAGAATLFYILLHAASKSLLFLSVGYVTHAAGNRNVYSLRGMQRSFPLASLYFWIAALTLMGVPFSGGYYAKILVSNASYQQGGTWLLTVAGVCTAAALFKLGRIFTGRWGASTPLQHTTRPHKPQPTALLLTPETRPPLLGVGMILSAGFCIAIAVLHQELFQFLIGIFPESLTCMSSAHSVIDIPWMSQPSLIKAAVITLIGFLCLFILHLRPVKILAQRVSIFLNGGLNRSLRLLILGILIFILFAAVSSGI